LFLQYQNNAKFSRVLQGLTSLHFSKKTLQHEIMYYINIFQQLQHMKLLITALFGLFVLNIHANETVVVENTEHTETTETAEAPEEVKTTTNSGVGTLSGSNSLREGRLGGSSLGESRLLKQGESKKKNGKKNKGKKKR